MHLFQKTLSLLLVMISVITVYAAWVYSTPSAVRHISWLLPGIWLSSISIIAVSLSIQRCFFHIEKNIWSGIALLAPLPIILMLFYSYQLYNWKQTIFSIDEELRHTLGQHFIIGYRDTNVISELATLGAIGGIYITKENVRGKSIQQIQQEINAFQQLRQANNLPPLIITTDQEGGIVSQLSPPLPKYQSLAEVINHLPENQQKQAAFAYGKQQGKELASIGINVNLSPVIDLTPERTSPNDKYSLIYRRAISKSANKTSEIALQYIKGLECSGVMATLKHFPGLGKVYGDTHVQGVHLTASVQELEQSDWKPFRNTTKASHALMMIGHVNINAIDKNTPASISRPVISTIIREKWQHQGVLITDDLTMDAIYKLENDHLQTASVKSINAGVDLLLISFDSRQFYSALVGLIEQYENKQTPRKALQRSKQRIDTLLKQLKKQTSTCQL